jgi:hypothetical protein
MGLAGARSGRGVPHQASKLPGALAENGVLEIGFEHPVGGSSSIMTLGRQRTYGSFRFSPHAGTPIYDLRNNFRRLLDRIFRVSSNPYLAFKTLHRRKFGCVLLFWV